jgi:hypothetical protein
MSSFRPGQTPKVKVVPTRPLEGTKPGPTYVLGGGVGYKEVSGGGTRYRGGGSLGGGLIHTEPDDTYTATTPSYLRLLGYSQRSLAHEGRGGRSDRERGETGGRGGGEGGGPISHRLTLRSAGRASTASALFPATPSPGRASRPYNVTGSYTLLLPAATAVSAFPATGGGVLGQRESPA